MRRCYFALALLLLCGITQAQDEEKKDDKLVSGPQPGSLLPGPFELYNVNGKHKGRFHCLACDFAQDPAVLVFAREPEKGKEAPLDMLLEKLDELAGKYQEHYLRGGVVFLSPGARSSVTEKKVEDAKELVAEAMARDALIARLEAHAYHEKVEKDADPRKLKHVVLACSVPEGPPAYKIAPKAALTIIFYKRLRVIENAVFESDNVTEENVAAVLEKIDKKMQELTRPKKK